MQNDVILFGRAFFQNKKVRSANSDHFSKIATDESPIKNTQCQLSQQAVISNYTHAQLAFGTCKRD